MIMSEDLVHMKRVMRRLELINKHDVPNLKGKAAASISAADEIITTELLFSGFFQDLDPV
jgi:ATP-dependent RNA helicase DOB1